jgi:hypothetical protein
MKVGKKHGKLSNKIKNQEVVMAPGRIRKRKMRDRDSIQDTSTEGGGRRGGKISFLSLKQVEVNRGRIQVRRQQQYDSLE